MEGAFETDIKYHGVQLTVRGCRDDEAVDVETVQYGGMDVTDLVDAIGHEMRIWSQLGQAVRLRQLSEPNEPDADAIYEQYAGK